MFDLLLPSAVFTVVFALHARWVLTHFSSDAYLLDSGWFAYLFASGDPLLHNPSAVNSLSFYAHHVSPHIFLFGAPLARLFHLRGTSILAVHAGFFFGLFFLSVYLIVAAAQLPWRRKAIGAAIAVCVGVFSNVLFQAAAYPHFEIAIIALSSLAIAAWVSGYRSVFALCLLWLPLVREDGGLYVAFVCLACLALDYPWASGITRHARVLLPAAAAGLLATAVAFAVQARYFPGFDAFANNFAGHGWDHVSAALVANRSLAMMTSLNTAPVLLGSLVLAAAFDVRYAAGLVLLSPLFALHLLSVRDEHGYFTLYFALPWLLPCALWLAVLVRRFGSVTVRVTESMLVLGLVLLGTAPAQAALGAKSQFWYVAKWAVERPIANIRDMQDFVSRARRGSATPGESPQARNCVSQGIAGLVPNQVRPDEVLNPADDLATCRTVILLRGDMHYPPLAAQAQRAGFKRSAVKENAEFWQR